MALKKYSQARLYRPASQGRKSPHFVDAVGVVSQAVAQVPALDKPDLTAVLILHQQIHQGVASRLKGLVLAELGPGDVLDLAAEKPRAGAQIDRRG